jgi:hypothetical protein
MFEGIGDRAFTWFFGDQNRETFGVACLTAALGIFSGYALYLLWWEQGEKQESGWTFVWALLAAASMSLAFEFLRGIIEGAEHGWTFSRVLTTIIMLAAFELFIISIHDSAELHLATFVNVAGYVFGEQFGQSVGAGTNLAALGGLWLWVALIVVFKLRTFITKWPYPDSHPEPAGSLGQYVSEMRHDLWRGAKTGFWAGVWWAPVSAILYVVAFRVYFLMANVHSTQPATENLIPASHLQGWMWGLLYGTTVIALLGAKYFGPIGIILGILAVTLIVSALASKENRAGVALIPALSFVVVCCVPIIVNSSARGDVYYLYFMSAVIWGIPATLLGLLAPLLRRPANHPSVWGLVAAVSAGVMMLVTIARFDSGAQWGERLLLISATVMMLVLAFVLFRGAWTEEVWLCVALSIGLIVWGTASLLQSVNLLGMQNTAQSLITLPVSPPDDSSPFDGVFASLQNIDYESTIDLTPSDSPLGLLPPGVDNVLFIENSCSMMRAFTPEQDAIYQKNLAQAVADDNAATNADNSTADKVNNETAGFAQTLANTLAGAQAQIPEADPPGPQIVEVRRRIATVDTLDASLHAELAAAKKPLHAAFSRIAQPTGPCQTDMDAELALLATADRQRSAAHQNLEQAQQTSVAQFQTDISTIEDERPALEAQLNNLQLVQAQHLELTMTSSLGFWLTIGLLAIWRLTHSDPE